MQRRRVRRGNRPDPEQPDPEQSDSEQPDPSNPVPGGCAATIRVAGQWQGGYQAEVQVRAGTGGTRGWAVSFTGTVQQGWNATFSGSGSSTVATNGSLAANGSATFGFIGTGTPPTASTCSAI